MLIQTRRCQHVCLKLIGEFLENKDVMLHSSVKVAYLIFVLAKLKQISAIYG